MAFIIAQGTGDVISYCEASDIRSADQRVFEANEFDLTGVPDSPASVEDYVEDLATKATARINQKIRASSRWSQYLQYVGDAIDPNDIPEFVPELILSRKQDFSDMCAYYTLKEYILPQIADFGNPESSEVQKIKYFENKFSDIFEELLAIMDWYDFDNSGQVDESEKRTRYQSRRRSRSIPSIARVR